MAAVSGGAGQNKRRSKNNDHVPNIKTCALIFTVSTFQGCRHQLQAALTSEIVKPSLLGSVMLNTIQMFFPVVHVVLKGPVTVVTEVSLPHGAGSALKPARRHFRNV